MGEVKKFVAGIHLEDYTEQFETNVATADTLLFVGGRKKKKV